jgi:N-acylneuraminate cytidylyltransferase
MIGGETVVAAVPARGGSTGVPRKNVRDLGGKPLVAWPIDVAHETEYVDRTVVTTDDDEIAATAREYGAEVVERPPELATDDALVVDAMRHLAEVLHEEGVDVTYVVMLEPTTPLREPQDVAACLELLADEANEYGSVATFTPAVINPHRTWRLDGDSPEPFVDGADPWLPRQKLPEAYQLNGGAYAFRVDAIEPDGHSLLFGEAGAVVMPASRSVDIDTETDFRIVETLLDDRPAEQ